MGPDEHPAERERGSASGRMLLAVALALTVTAIAVGTWVLGSGSDPIEQQERATTVVSDLGAPGRAQPPLQVAPPPAGESTDTTG
jgi:hypothetical protein